MGHDDKSKGVFLKYKSIHYKADGILQTQMLEEEEEEEGYLKVECSIEWNTITSSSVVLWLRLPAVKRHTVFA